MCLLAQALKGFTGSGWQCSGSPLKPTFAVCSYWQDVICSGSNVVSINVLASTAIYGSLPTAIGVLSSLTTLELGSSKLTGTIPSTIGLLTKLVTLKLGPDKFVGTLPTSLGDLGSLTYFGVSHNSLTGSIPTELCALSATMDYTNNRFTCYPSCLTAGRSVSKDATLPLC